MSNRTEQPGRFRIFLAGVLYKAAVRANPELDKETELWRLRWNDNYAVGMHDSISDLLVIHEQVGIKTQLFRNGPQELVVPAKQIRSKLNVYKNNRKES